MITKIAEGDKEDVDLAVKAARQAFDHGPWPRLPGSVCTSLSYPISRSGVDVKLGAFDYFRWLV